MPGVSFRISLDGAQQVNAQLDSVAKTAEQSFASTTASISRLGKTADQAFATATVAAKQFGASVTDLNKVQGTIQNLADQAQASGISFSKMARNFDSARGAIGGTRSAFAGAAAGARLAGTAAEESARGFSLSRREIGALKTAFRELNLGAVGGEFAALARVASVFGPMAVGLTAVGAAIAGTTALLLKFANSAAETAAALTKLQDVSGQSFESLSALQQVFAQGGTDAKTFANEFTKLFEEIGDSAKTMANDVQASTAETAQAEADAFRARMQAGKTVGVQNEAILKQLDARAAKAKLDVQATKAQVAAANDLGDAIKQFQSLARGGNAVFDSLTTIETKAKAVRAVLADIGQKGGDQFKALSDIIRALPIDQARALQKALGLSDTTFDSLRKGGQALNALRGSVLNLGTTLTTLDQQNLKSLTNSWNTLIATISAATQKLGANWAAGLIQGIEAAKKSILDLVNLPIGENLLHALEGVGTVLKQVFVDSWVAIGAAAANSFMTNFIGPIGQAFSNLPSAIISGLSALGEIIASAASAVGQSFATNFIGPIQEAFSNLPNAIMNALSALGGIAASAGSAVAEAFNSGIQSMVSLVQTVVQQISSFLERLAEKARSLFNTLSGGGGGSAEPGSMPMASGGLIGGRGTGTSDSNLAWLSRGEYITPARAVRQPGVLAFLEALRRSGGNLRGVLDDMGHFARGGLVLPMPAFAAGGFNTGGSSSRVMHLTIGSETFRNLSVPESTALSLERFAVHSQIASTGRKPSWRR
jgi:uncharacterized membrane-anchored protein YhcB (DUF1043 family)